MIIQSSQIEQECAYSLKVRHEEKAYRREAVIQNDPDTVQVTLSRQARSLLQGTWAMSATAEHQSAQPPPLEENEPGGATAALETAPTCGDETKLEILLRTMEKFTGKKFHFAKVGVALHLSGQGKPAMTGPGDGRLMQEAPENGPARPDNGMRLIETYSETTHSEWEAATVKASGTVTTADGREIVIDLKLGMARAYHAQDTGYSLTIAPLTDPLVINYDGNAADLTEDKYAFDLNADGIEEQISFVSPGNGGFLALDRNGDGIVNDGSELFGVATGNGFSELTDFDEDANGWIDEGDTVFFDLSVWEKDDNGNDRLVALADTGIGAIYLTAVDSPFRLTDSDNQTLGQVKATGVYLKEDGGAGTIQQIDLAT